MKTIKNIDSKKLLHNRMLKLVDDLMYNITCTHLDMGGNHKYSLRHGAHPIISEIKNITGHLMEIENNEKDKVYNG